MILLPIAFPESKVHLIASTLLESSGARVIPLSFSAVIRQLKQTRSFVLESSSMNSLISCSLKQTRLEIIIRDIRRVILQYSSLLDSFVILYLVIRLPRNFRKITWFWCLVICSDVTWLLEMHRSISFTVSISIPLIFCKSFWVFFIWNLLATPERKIRHLMASKSARIVLRPWRIRVLHFGHRFCLISTSSFSPPPKPDLSNHWFSVFTSITWPQSTSSTNMAPVSLPLNSAASSLQTRHNFGQTSPQIPTHEWPHESCSWHGFSHLWLLYGSAHSSVPSWCEHGLSVRWQGWPQLRLQRPHGSEQGGQARTHRSLHLWPQNRVRSQVELQGKWRRPSWHLLQ